MSNYFKKHKTDFSSNKNNEADKSNLPSTSHQSSSNSESVEIFADVDNRSVTNSFGNVELQPCELTQKLNFVHDVIDIGFVVKSKTYYRFGKQRAARKPLETAKRL